MQVVKLSIQDRVSLSVFLSPVTEGTRLFMTLVYSLKKIAEFTPEEIECFDIKEDSNGNITCRENHEIDVNLSDQQLEIIDKCISLADDNAMIHITMVPFIEKIDKLIKR